MNRELNRMNSRMNRELKKIRVWADGDMTHLVATYVIDGGMEIEVGQHTRDGDNIMLHQQLNTDLACILYRVLQCIGSYEGRDILNRPEKGEITFTESTTTRLFPRREEITLTRVEADDGE
jgi:hypothetical protein